MAKLNANFASRPRPDSRRVAIALGLVLGLATVLAATGWALLRPPATGPLQGDIARLEQRIGQSSTRSEAWTATIDRQKGQWQSRIQLANQLIAAKTFSYCALLDELEALIPDGVQITSVTLLNQQRSPLEMRVAAASFERLMELYKGLAPHGLVISQESESAGLYQAVIQICLPGRPRP